VSPGKLRAIVFESANLSSRNSDNFFLAMNTQLLENHPAFGQTRVFL